MWYNICNTQKTLKKTQLLPTPLPTPCCSLIPSRVVSITQHYENAGCKLNIN